MTTGRLGPVLVAVTVGLLTGCVDRRFVVETSVPGAQIAVDGTPLGPSPVDSRWEYAGSYQLTASLQVTSHWPNEFASRPVGINIPRLI